MNETLDVRRELLRSEVLPKLREPIRYAEELHGSVPDLLKAVRSYGFEGLVAKRRDSLYESGKRSGAWRKVRVIALPSKNFQQQTADQANQSRHLTLRQH